MTQTAQVGVRLTLSNGTWSNSPTSFAYQWKREGSDIAGAVNNQYTPVAADLGSILEGDVIASNGSGSSAQTRSALTSPVISATPYYVSSSTGNDSWTGRAPAQVGSTTTGPWKTIAKVNSYSASPGFAAGTSILFKRGDKWDRSGGPSVTATFFPAHGGTSGNPIVYDAYGTGANPIIDGSADASSTSNWTNIGTNLWQSVQTFAPTGGTNGLPYFNANDVGNILWGFSALGGSAPAAVNSASFGKMTGGGVGGVWYKPGDGTANIGSTQGNWNFNTDNYKVQIYSVGNPATAMPGLRLVLDGGGIVLASSANSNMTFQNLTFQYIGGSNACKINNASNIIVRDVVFQWIGGGNIGGASSLGSRAGDAYNIEGAYAGYIIIERNYIYQMYDVGISPQLSTSGHHDNLTWRNNIIHHIGTAFGVDVAGTTGSTQSGLNIYNNTVYGVSSWSANQRPNGFPVVKSFDFSYDSGVTTSNINVENNVSAGLIDFGLELRAAGPSIDLSSISSVVWDYNNWNQLAGTGTLVRFAKVGVGNQNYTTWAATYGFDTHGLIDVDPQFTNPGSADFTPQVGSPLLSAGANLSSQGVVWDFNKTPRPASGAFTIGAIQ